MPRVTQQHRDERREQILAAARRCFLRDGFHGTSMHDLFAEADLSSGAVYGYFASKDDVIVAIAEENLQDVVAMIHVVAMKQPDRSVGLNGGHVPGKSPTGPVDGDEGGRRLVGILEVADRDAVAPGRRPRAGWSPRGRRRRR